MRNESRVPDDFFFFLIKFVTRPARGYRARENFSSRHDVHKSSAGRVDVRLWKVKICIGTYTGILNCSIRNDVPPPDWILSVGAVPPAMIYYQSVRVLRVIYARCPTTTTGTAHSFHKSASNFTEQFDADLQNDRPLSSRPEGSIQLSIRAVPETTCPANWFVHLWCMHFDPYFYIMDVDYFHLSYLIIGYNGREHFHN